MKRTKAPVLACPLASPTVNEKVLKNSQYSGILSLAHRELTEVPSAVWNLNVPIKPANSVVDFNASNDETKWWETRPITRLTLSFNQISSIPGPELRKLDTLVFLDIRDNLVSDIPSEIGSLVNLKQLIISSNKIANLPTSVTNLKFLTLLDVSHNPLTELPDNLSDIEALEKLDASDCQLKTLPKCLPRHLFSFHVSSNQLSFLPPGMLQHSRLVEFIGSENQLQDIGLLPDGPENSLTVLNLHRNSISELPDMSMFKQLKELTLGNNKITDMYLKHFTGLTSLATLNLAQNQINKVPAGISSTLPNLIRLDLSNNNISSIPNELGFMESLSVICLTGNPLKSISQSVLTTGNESIKSLLRSRQLVDEKENTNSSNESSTHNLKNTSICSGDSLPCVTPAGILDWNGTPARGRPTTTPLSLPPTDDESVWFDLAMKNCSNLHLTVSDLRLSFRKLDQLPLGLLAFRESLRFLNLSHNQIKELPDELFKIRNLENFNISSNQLTKLNENFSTLCSLNTLVLDYNPGLGPEFPFKIICQGSVAKTLQNLSVCGCKIKSLPAADIFMAANMPALTSLNVADNDIDSLEPKLGLCQQITNLRIEGNTFRIPRPAVVAKGTGAVMEYLRSRIAE